jgi:smad nuclear-interacting protein 1
MSFAKDPSSRKRSKWGDDDRKEAPPAAAAASVSDQEAVNALLASAHARQEETKPRPKKQRQEEQKEDIAPENVQKADFGLSGALAKDEGSGNMYKGVVLKFSEPPEARAPNTQWRLYVFKKEELLQTLHVSKQSAYLLGRNRDIADIPLEHPSCSSQHAVLQYRALPNPETGKLNCQPYLMDLESTNGCFINGIRIDSARYYQLKKGDVIKFGASTREYVLLTPNTTSIK